MNKLTIKVIEYQVGVIVCIPRIDLCIYVVHVIPFVSILTITVGIHCVHILLIIIYLNHKKTTGNIKLFSFHYEKTNFQIPFFI